jgi:AcrR family transcriptional regulator
LNHSEQDATRTRLLEAAGIVFAEKGFNSATVREICLRAGANVAAVNYHFGDKVELYVEVFRRSMVLAQQAEVEQLLLPPEQALTAIITGMVRRMQSSEEGAAWHVRIMAHELAQPTAALDRVVQEVIGPRYASLRTLVSHIIGLPVENETTTMCVLSVIAQVVHYAHARPVISRICPDMDFDPDRIGRHISTFSIAGLRAIAASNATSQEVS